MTLARDIDPQVSIYLSIDLLRYLFTWGFSCGGERANSFNLTSTTHFSKY